MGNFNYFNNNNNIKTTANFRPKQYFLLENIATFNISIDSNNKYFIKLSEIKKENKIYIKIIKISQNKLVNTFFDNSFDIHNLSTINNYFKSINTIDNCYKNIYNLINEKKIKINIDNNDILSLILFELNNNSEIILSKLNLNKNFQLLNELKFKKNPNFIYKNKITNIKSIFGCNDIFEVFYNFKDNNQYLISLSMINNNLNIINLDQEESNYNIIKELKGHNDPVTLIKYFLNENNLEQYLLSSDISGIVIIWDINNIFNSNVKHIIKTGYNEYIFSCLILFNINNDNIIITSTVDSSQTDNSYSRIYSLNNNCKLIKNILGTNENISLHLLFWFNRKNLQNYLIECCQGKICVYNLEKNEIYCEMKSDNNSESYCCGIIYKKHNEDYLITTSDGDYIRIWNLYNKKMIGVIKTEYCGISYIIRWSDIYYIIADQENYSFKVIDIEQLKVITDNKVNIKNKEKGVICIKKMYHPKYGESILTCDGDKEIKLWILK